MAVKVASLSPDLQESLRFESTLAEPSSRFVNLEPGNADREIEELFGGSSAGGAEYGVG